MNQGLTAAFTVCRATFRLDIDLAIPPGTTVALLGPNGAGKSTSLAAIAGLLPIASGRIELSGTVLDDGAGRFVTADHRHIGVVFQDYLLFPHMTAAENVAFGLRTARVSRSEARERAREWLDRVGLGASADRRPGDLSGGQAQRVALARALVTEPQLLLLDEPLAALDVTTRSELRHVLAEHLEAFAGPRLLITHDPDEAFVLADEIHVLEDGVVTQVGDGDDIRLRPRTRYAADLGGSNLLHGMATDGDVVIDRHLVHSADPGANGPVRLTIHPAAISLHPDRPEGSQRNVWPTTVDRIERSGARVRLRTGAPLPLMVEVTAAASDELHLQPGAAVWLAVKATGIDVAPEAAPDPATDVATDRR